MLSVTCRDLLASSRQFSGTYGAGLANHLPMALLALDRLGASGDRLTEFARTYQRRLRPRAPSPGTLSFRNWSDAIANAEYETALIAAFDEGIEARGARAVLSEVVPRLCPGIGSAAFHGLIRTAYAFESGENGEVAAALTYWVTEYDEPGPAEPAQRSRSVEDVFAAFREDPSFAADAISGPSITARMRTVVADPRFARHRGELAGAKLDELARVAVAAYVATANFTALHMVTACHAARILQPFLSPDALAHLGEALLAAYGTIGRPHLDPVAAPGGTPEHGVLAARAIASDDDHDHKFTYSCLEEESRYGWKMHGLAAAIRLRLASPPTSG